jgi:Arc/MetJ-type ribon-helix-helix transcriptional regulator
MTAELAENFSMRLSKQDRKDMEEGKALLAEVTGIDASVSDFIRIAAREKLGRMREEKAKRKAGK